MIHQNPHWPMTPAEQAGILADPSARFDWSGEIIDAGEFISRHEFLDEVYRDSGMTEDELNALAAENGQ